MPPALVMFSGYQVFWLFVNPVPLVYACTQSWGRHAEGTGIPGAGRALGVWCLPTRSVEYPLRTTWETLEDLRKVCEVSTADCVLLLWSGTTQTGICSSLLFTPYGTGTSRNLPLFFYFEHCHVGTLFRECLLVRNTQVRLFGQVTPERKHGAI